MDKCVRDVRLDNREVIFAPGPTTKCFELIFFRLINYNYIILLSFSISVKTTWFFVVVQLLGIKLIFKQVFETVLLFCLTKN